MEHDLISGAYKSNHHYCLYCLYFFLFCFVLLLCPWVQPTVVITVDSSTCAFFFAAVKQFLLAEFRTATKILPERGGGKETEFILFIRNKCTIRMI